MDNKEDLKELCLEYIQYVCIKYCMEYHIIYETEDVMYVEINNGDSSYYFRVNKSDNCVPISDIENDIILKIRESGHGIYLIGTIEELQEIIVDDPIYGFSINNFLDGPLE